MYWKIVNNLGRKSSTQINLVRSPFDCHCHPSAPKPSQFCHFQVHTMQSCSPVGDKRHQWRHLYGLPIFGLSSCFVDPTDKHSCPPNHWQCTSHLLLRMWQECCTLSWHVPCTSSEFSQLCSSIASVNMQNWCVIKRLANWT